MCAEARSDVASDDAEPPASLFKYKALPAVGDVERDYVREIITKGVLYHAKPEQLNDPFDLLPSWTDDVSEQALQQLFASRHEDLRLCAPNPKVKAELRDKFVMDWKRREKWEEAWRSSASKLGVFSVSEVPHSILVWSHYTSGFSGVCLELGLRPNSVPKVPTRAFLERAPLKVEYLDCRPRVSVAEFVRRLRGANSPSDEVKASLTVKSSDWKYEREWRLIRHFDDVEDRSVRFDPGIVKSVIVGPRTSEEDKRAIQVWIEEGGAQVRLRTSRLDPAAFRINIDP